MSQTDAYTPAVEIAALIREKKLSPVEVVDSLLDRIDRINPSINAFCTVAADQARQAAKRAEAAVMRGDSLGPLHGVPVAVKDLTATKHIRTTFGSRVYENNLPDEDDIIVERLLTAGAIIVGKTNTPEFGHKGTTDNRLFGVTRNPWNLERHAGGSSGGSAAAVASGLGPLATGSDGGGSIRIPASFCGVFGLKPSYGRVPRGPGAPDWQTLSHQGPISRTVDDAALMLGAIAGRDERDRHSLADDRLDCYPLPDGDLKGVRIGWSPDLGHAPVDPEVLEATTAATRVFETTGATVDEAGIDVEHQGRHFAAIWAATYAAKYAHLLDEWRDQMDPSLVAIIDGGIAMTATQYAEAAAAREAFWQNVRPCFEKFDFLLTPTLSISAFDAALLNPPDVAGVSGMDWTPFTYPFNFTGQPAASVPCGWTKGGLPIGLQIVGRRFDDIGVLKVAAAFEKAAPWADAKPNLD